MDRNRRLISRLLIVIGAVTIVVLPIALFARWWAAGNEPDALVHITFPPGYSFRHRSYGRASLGEVMDKGYAAVYLRRGLQVLQFEKKGQSYGAMVDVRGGGEIYTGFAEKDIHPILRLQEAQ